MMKLLVTRPEPDDAAFKAELEALGHKVSLSPLVRIEFTDQVLDLDGISALAVTSRNALRALARSPVLEQARALPLFTVGPGSGTKARSLGFKEVVEGSRAALDLVPVITGHASSSKGVLLHLSGDHRAADLPGELERSGLSVRTETVYRAVAASSFAPGIADRILSRGIDGVVLMSPRTAKIYVEIVKTAALQNQAAHLYHFCLSNTVALALGGLPVTKVEISSSPNAKEMLALIIRVAAKSG